MKIIAKIEKGEWLYVTSDEAYIGHNRYIKLSEIVSFEDGYSSGWPVVRLNVKGDIQEIVESKQRISNMILSMLNRNIIMRCDFSRVRYLNEKISKTDWDKLIGIKGVGYSIVSDLTYVDESNIHMFNKAGEGFYTKKTEKYSYRGYYGIKTYGELFSVTKDEFLKHKGNGRKKWEVLQDFVSTLKSSAEWKMR